MKKIYTMWLTAILVFLLVGCEQEVPPSGPPTFEEAVAANYYEPWTLKDDGSGVYFISMKGIWYLKDGVATRVVDSESSE